MTFAIALLALHQGPVFRTAELALTPDEHLSLGGYTKRGDAAPTEKGEALFARALVFEEEGTTVAVVSYEALTVPESLYAAVQSRIPEGVRLVLTATHTHSAPDSQMLNERMTFKIPGIAAFSRRWMEWYADMIAQCVKSALASEPTPVSELELRTAEVLANRGRREGAEPVRTATFVSYRGKPLLVSYAAHATLYDDTRATTSGDWPGAVSSRLGGLVLVGAIGDVSPDAPHKSVVENLDNLVDKLRAGYQAAQVKALPGVGRFLGFVEEEIKLAAPEPHPEFADSFGAPAPLAKILVQRFAPTRAHVTLTRLGRVLMIGVPGEPTSAVGRALTQAAAAAGFPHSFVVSHTNGWIGYVLEPVDYQKGGYEATLSFHGAETAKRLTEAVERALKRLGQEPLVAQTRYPRSNTAFRSAW